MSTEIRPLLLWFDDPASTPDLVGSKGGNLARLTQQDFPVPPGATVTTEAYLAAVRSGGLHEAIADIVAGIDYDDTADLDARAAKIRTLVEDAPIPQQMADDIGAAYARLAEKTGGAEPYVAVRSSGTAEDLADASFAGLHDT